MSSNALVKAREETAQARGALSRFRREQRSPMSKIADVLTIEGGAAGAGVVRALAPAQVMGVPTEAAAALVTLGAGVALGSPTLVLGAAGMAAPTVRDFVATSIASARA